MELLYTVQYITCNLHCRGTTYNIGHLLRKLGKNVKQILLTPTGFNKTLNILMHWLFGEETGSFVA